MIFSRGLEDSFKADENSDANVSMEKKYLQFSNQSFILCPQANVSLANHLTSIYALVARAFLECLIVLLHMVRKKINPQNY